MPTILLVEDDEAHAELIRHAFERQDPSSRLVVARNLAQARQYLQQESSVLIISDLFLPDGRGIELLGEGEEQAFPLIIMTSHGDEKIAVEAIKAGALDYVVKSSDILLSMPRVAQRAHREWSNIQERRNLQQQLNQAQKMESIGRLAGGIAHDFNNLLTIILGFTDIATNEAEDNLPIQKSIQQIRQAAERACGLTRQLLTFSRRHASSLQPLDLGVVLSETEQMLRGVVDANFELRFETDRNLPLVNGDQGQIQQVLVNLTLNARDSMDQRGNITVLTESVTLDSNSSRVPAGDYVRIAVSDTGTGMTAEVMEKVFEPFYTTKKSGKGTGLGLATCYGIVQQHGGHITVHSRLNEGSTFEVYFPALPGTVSIAVEPVITNILPEGRETVLVAEDELLVRALTTRILRSLGYIVLEAVDGQDALETADRHDGQIDILVTDVVMPRMGGYELAKTLREKRQNLKVLYVSGYTTGEEFQRVIAQKRAPLLHKPFSRAALAESVRDVLDGNHKKSG